MLLRCIDGTHTYSNIYLQLGGGSTVISANSFWIRFAEVVSAFEPFVAFARSLFLEDDEPLVPVDADVDAITLE